MADVFVSVRAQVGGDPIEGVSVGLYAAGVRVTIESTGVDGLAFLGDRATGSYELYITAPVGGQVVGGSRQAVTVADADAHIFDTFVNLSSLPVATSAAFCRCSGFFVDSFGRPARGATLTFSESDFPQLLPLGGPTGSIGVRPGFLSAVTDSDGWVSVDLLRSAKYYVTMAGYENTSWEVSVPDLSFAPIPDVLFPTVVRLEYAQSGNTLLPTSAPTLAVATGEEVTLTLVTQYRSGARATGAVGISTSSSDANILEVSLTGDSIVVKGIAAGTATVEVTRSETQASNKAIPEGTLQGTLTVTVT